MSRNRKTFSTAMALGVLVLLGACASIPDAANPVEWYRGTVDYFTGDDKEAEKKKAKEKAEADRQRRTTRDTRAQAQAPAQAAPAQAQPQTPTPTAPAAGAQEPRTSEVADVSERLAGPTRRGLLADTGGGRPRYAQAIPRQAEDPGPPAARAAATPSAPSEAQPVPAPRAPVSATAPAPAPAAAPQPAPRAARPPEPAREVAATPPPRPQPPAPEPRAAQAAPSPAPAAAPAPSAPPRALPDPPVPPARPVTVADTYRALLAEQTRLPSAGALDLAGDPGTLIISSEGLETSRPARARADTASAALAEGAGRSLFRTAIQPAGSVEGLADRRATKVATILFADGSARLDEEARQVLDRVAKLQREQGGTVRVVGHASMRTKPMDPDRHGKVNEGISIARANAVAGHLARLGVKRETIVVNARGAADPAYYEVMETGEAGNRRAEVYLDF